MPITLDGTGGMTAPVGAVYNGLVTMTAANPPSGTSVDFTGIPLWVKRITIMLNAVDATGGDPLVQLGSGSVTTSGYVSTGANINNSSTSNLAASSSTSGFVIRRFPITGHMIITNVVGNVWVASHSGRNATTSINVGGGSVTLSGSLDRVRVTTSSGTDTFNAGSFNVMYE